MYSIRSQLRLGPLCYVPPELSANQLSHIYLDKDLETFTFVCDSTLQLDTRHHSARATHHCFKVS